MSFFEKMRDKAKERYEEYSADRKAYKETERKAYLKERKIQARIKGRQKAQARSKSFMDNIGSFQQGLRKNVSTAGFDRMIGTGGGGLNSVIGGSSKPKKKRKKRGGGRSITINL